MKNIDFTGDSGRGTQNGEKEEDTILKRRRRILRDNCEPLLKTALRRAFRGDHRHHGF
jgi:hypothetical protein